MKLNKLFTASLLAALAMGAYACGGDDDDSCTNGEYKACSDSTHAVVCQNNKWVTIDCGKSSKVCSNDTHKCVEQGGGGNGGGGNGGDASSAVNTFCESVASCSSESGAKEECLETFKELSGSKKCASQVNALFECAAKISDCQAKVMAVMGMDDTCATQLAAVESCDEGGDSGNVGDACDRSTYKQSCINNGANALVCWDDVVTQWDCTTCQDDASDPLKVKCERGGGDACTASSTSGCAPACDPSGTKGYYWSNNDGLKTYECYSGKQCRINDKNRVECYCPDGATCEGGGDSCDGKLRTGGSVGEACDRNCYTQSCINNGANALVCWDDVVTQWTCANTCQDAGYDSSKPLQVKCDKGNGGNNDDLDDCTDSSDSKCAAACKADKSEGYYWNNSQSSLVKLTCTENQECRLNGTSVNCIAKDLPATCSGSKCSELDGNAYFCDLESQSFYFVERQGKCSDSNACLICPDGFGGCGTDCSEGGHNELCTSPTKTENGNVNDCCDSLEYMPSCDGNVLNYCRSWGKVETKTCSSSCSVNTSTKKYTCK